MKKYIVEVSEVLQRMVVVEAENANDAQNIVRLAYRDEHIVLDSNDFIGEAEFECVGTANN